MLCDSHEPQAPHYRVSYHTKAYCLIMHDNLTSLPHTSVEPQISLQTLCRPLVWRWSEAVFTCDFCTPLCQKTELHPQNIKWTSLFFEDLCSVHNMFLLLEMYTHFLHLAKRQHAVTDSPPISIPVVQSEQCANFVQLF